MIDAVLWLECISPPMSTCSICMEFVGAIDSRGDVGQLVSTECKHIYHEACLSRWMKR